MADTQVRDPRADYPLFSELKYVNYLRDITGNSSTNSYTPAQAVAGQAPRLDSEQLSSIMTEWLRGNGKFLENMQSQNQSGLYNSSTRRLVANDLTAQAALKAATANQDIDKTNAGLQTQVALENARLQTAANLNNSKATSKSSTLLDLALAAGMNMFKGENIFGKKKTEAIETSGTAGGDTGFSAPQANYDIPAELMSSPMATDTFTSFGDISDANYGSQFSNLISNADMSGWNMDFGSYGSSSDSGGSSDSFDFGSMFDSFSAPSSGSAWDSGGSDEGWGFDWSGMFD